MSNRNEQVRSSMWGWEKVDSADESRAPTNRSLHAGAVFQDSLYIFGGYDGNNRVNDMFEFHFPSKTVFIHPTSSKHELHLANLI